uniref:glucuronosyltransferase n=1 Tax=Acrobeloides nanus TaxID=290746 RepID=A0A914C6P4_9BILA
MRPHQRIPLIATPLFADQNYNAFIVKQKETGVYINFKEISAKLIQDALEEVLYSDKYYQNAQKLKKSLQSYPYKAHEKFVKYVEYAAENSFNDDLNLAA